MISRWAAWIAGIVIGITLVAVVAIEIDERNAAPIEIEMIDRGDAILVEIAGAVTEPGVYELDRGDRIVDLIDAASGLLPDADTSALNQAAEAIDGSKITVPFVGADDSFATPAAQESYGLVDLNRASAETLQILPGIGLVRAQAIVEFRNQHGPFSSIEELTLVDGISLAVVDGLRALVTVRP